MTNFHLHCEKNRGEKKIYVVYIFHATLNEQIAQQNLCNII